MATPTIDSEKVLAPRIHLNGTGAETLISEYEAAMSAIASAIETASNVTVNARDYHVISPEAFRAAVAQHQSAIDKLRESRAHFVAVFEAIMNQQG